MTVDNDLSSEYVQSPDVTDAFDLSHVRPREFVILTMLIMSLMSFVLVGLGVRPQN